jgi:hypothetical protein
MLAPRSEPSAEEIKAMFTEDAEFEAEIAALKAQIAGVWIKRAPVHARLVEYKRRVREQRLGAAMIEKIRQVGETGTLPEEPKPIPEYRRI